MSYPIVGAYYRPPAKAILQVLPGGAPLRLRPEPSNRFDPDAVQVCVSTDAIPESQHQELELLASGHGMSLEDILAQEEWHIGYVPRGCGLAQELAGEDAEGRLTFGMKGEPMVEVLT